MQRFREIEPVLAVYPIDVWPTAVEPLEGAGGFSGALLWSLTTPRGRLAVRRLPAEEQDTHRREWIAAVVDHVAGHGFFLLPAIIRTRDGAAVSHYGGYSWELTSWMPGRADYWGDPRSEKLCAAMEALAAFHRAAESFPLGSHAGLACTVSPGLVQRMELVDYLLAGGIDDLRAAVVKNRQSMPALVDRSQTMFNLLAPHLKSLREVLDAASRIETSVQPCLRDIWHDHVLFEGDRVSGIVDLGAMRVESVAADVARLLGSLCGNDRDAWTLGQTAYEATRPLSLDERCLVQAFDRSQILLSGVRWVQWVFAENRTFSDPKAVVKRMEHILSRLTLSSKCR